MRDVVLNTRYKVVSQGGFDHDLPEERIEIRRISNKNYLVLHEPLEEVKMWLDALKENGVRLNYAEAAFFLYGTNNSSYISRLTERRKMKYETDEEGNRFIRPKEVLRKLKEGKHCRWKAIKTKPRKPEKFRYFCEGKSKEEIREDLAGFAEKGILLTKSEGDEIIYGTSRNNSLDKLVNSRTIKLVDGKVRPYDLLWLMGRGYGRWSEKRIRRTAEEAIS